jgi:hypothetical protein
LAESFGHINPISANLPVNFIDFELVLNGINKPTYLFADTFNLATGSTNHCLDALS